MIVLLDTQCWLWMNEAPERFSGDARRLIESRETSLLLSSASAWEIAIKYGLGKLRLPVSPAEYVPSRLQPTRTSPLPISHEHALRTAELPPHHRDPFDRLLVAQAQIERLPVLTADGQFEAYDVDVIWALPRAVIS
jgi:PIN domain nuclease of toxin-antitoxin system